MKSSSGGVFPALSASIIEHGGVVYGAVLISPQKVRHIRISQLEDLIQLQGSKYVQSDISHIFPMVLEDLKEGLPVLFSGTPCQVKALHLYLQKPFANLLTVEVVCHGDRTVCIAERQNIVYAITCHSYGKLLFL